MELGRYLRLKPLVGMVRRMDITPVQTVKGRWDNSRLRERMPAFADYETLAAPIRRRLDPHHGAYIQHVSNDTMAASLPLSTFLEVMCRVIHPQRVVDLGSGFSSFVLRNYASHAPDPIEVHSVDDHGGWLEKTRQYLSRHKLSTENVWEWSAFIAAATPRSFDLVLHDMGSMEFRAETLPEVLTLGRPGGYVVLDDVHKPAYRKRVHQVLSERGLNHLSLKQITVDNKARYSYLVFT